MASLNRYENVELIKLPDCEGLLENGKCNYLNISKCSGAKCPYFRHKGTQNDSYKRLCILDESTQNHIAHKYYNGKRPWKEHK